MEIIVAIPQPMGQEIQMPVAASAVRESTSASTTRSVRSVKVAITNCYISPAPRITPSATTLDATTK